MNDPADLMAFLRARLDEDERLARAADTGRPWQADGTAVISLHPTDRVLDWASGEAPEHIARHDPARVLAEVEAKRRIIELHRPAGQEHRPDCAVCLSDRERWSTDWTADRWPCPTLRLLALPHADHPDYRPEWSPGG